MSQGDVETYAVDGGWGNRVIGGEDLPGVHPNRQDAVRAGTVESETRHVHHVIRYVGPPTAPPRRT